MTIEAQVCPVCRGRRTVPANFYGYAGTSAVEETCQSCDGKGYILVETQPQWTVPKTTGGNSG